ncbi:OmpA family protein [Flavobacterium oreochromis]|uniref:OmpA family protein n=1 Tax=Flavobacterium oreochromis TaxID=2906078 RepID=UPI00385BB195
MKTTVKLNRYEPCKFDEIAITETETKDGKASTSTVKVFDNGKGLKSAKRTVEKVTTSIYFKFDVDVVDEKSKQALQNVLNFLLEHPHSGIRLEGFACVIGKQNYNNGLSQRRSDAVKKFFLDGGLKADRILSIGKGEVNATDDKQGRDNIKYKDEFDYIHNRRVDVSFTFEGHNAQTIVYETIAPSSDKNILLEVKGFETKSCFKTKDKHTKKIKVTSPAYPAAKVQNGDKIQIPVHSTLEAWNPAPIQYFWPRYNAQILAESANPYNVFVHSCRYFSNEQNSVILIKVFPDIKWELAFEVKIDIKHYSHTNMPSEMGIFARHQELATKNGYKRHLLNKDKEIPITIGFGLSAEWNDEQRKVNVSKEWEKKIETFAKYFAKTVELVQDGINVCRGLAKSTSIPVSFGVEYPKIEATFEWKLKRAKKSLTNLAVGGTVNFGAKPLIGANTTIDLIAAAVSVASYSTTGSPAIAKIIQKVRDTGKKVGTEINAEAKFYGNLEVLFKDMKFNTIDGWEGSSYVLIGGKMGMTLMIEGKIGNSPFYKKKKPIIEFSAIARAKGDAYFGGTLKIDYDESKKSMYIEPSVKFSGLEIVLEAEVTIGWFQESVKKKYEEVVPSKEIKFEKKYLNPSQKTAGGGGW